MRTFCIASLVTIFSFAANAATVTVTAPNGGESLVWGSINCTWTSTGLAAEDLMEVALSLDGGATWTVVESSTSNDGSTSFTSPTGTAYTQCRVRVRAVTTLESDESDADFSLVPPPASIFVMMMGSFTAGGSGFVNWSSTGVVGNVNIDLSIDGKQTWTRLISNTPNDGWENFSVPNTPSSTCHFRVQDVDGDPTGISDMPFSILPEFASITVTAPVGGTYPSGQPITVEWLSTNLTSMSVDIDFSYDGGVTWVMTRFSTPNDGTESVTPYVSSTTPSVLVRVRDTDGSPSGVSMPFTVTSTAPSAPTGLTATLMGSQVQLSWTDNSTNESRFEIQRSTEPTFMFSMSFTAMANQTSFVDISAPSNSTLYYRVRAYGPMTGMPPLEEVSGFSNVVTVTTPIVSGPSAPSGLSGVSVSSTQVNLSWMDNSLNETGFEIQRSTDPNFTTMFFYFAPMNVSFFTDNNAQPNTTYYYRVRASGPTFSGFSNVATVTTLPPPPPSVSILYPNASDYVSAGSSGSVNIQTQNISGPLTVEFSQDSGATWSLLANYALPYLPPNGNANYFIPVNYPVIVSNTCRVRVTDVPTGLTAESDGDFRFVVPFDITHPKGGETFYIGQSQTFEVRDIDWYLSSVTFEISRDGGATWEALGTVSGEDRLYSGNIPFTWTVSGPASKNCKIRVSAVVDGVPLPLDGQMFTISEIVGAGGGTPSGPAGGDLTGTYPDPVIASQAVTTNKIADGAVTSGPVPPFGVGGKISSAGMSPDRVLASDGAGGTLWKHLDDVVFGSTGLTPAQQFVSKQGDTMTGPLAVPQVLVDQDGLHVGNGQLVTMNGRVGIGTATPTSKLTVSGVIETDNGVKIGTTGKQTSAVQGGIAPVTLIGKNHLETITDPKVKAGSVIVVSLLDDVTTDNKDATLTLRQVSNGSFTVWMSSANPFTKTNDKIHYIILVSPD